MRSNENKLLEVKCLRTRKKKGQAAIEFLTTYSWAILAILLSIGVLSYFDLLSVERYVRENCETGNQVICRESQIVDGRIRLSLANTYPVDIEIHRITYTKEGRDPIPQNDVGDAGVIPRGGVRETQPHSLQDFDLQEGRKETVGVIITFSRAGSARHYNVTGSTTATVR